MKMGRIAPKNGFSPDFPFLGYFLLCFHSATYFRDLFGFLFRAEGPKSISSSHLDRNRLSGTESAILNRESGDLSRAILRSRLNIDRLRFRLATPSRISTRERKGPPEIIQKNCLRTGRFRVRISLWLLWKGQSTINWPFLGEGFWGNVRCPLVFPAPFPQGQSLKKFKILKISSEIEIFKRATHQSPIFCGECWRSGLKFSSEIEHFKRDSFSFNLWALRVVLLLRFAVRDSVPLVTAGFLYRAGAGTPLSFREKFRVFPERFWKISQGWIPKPDLFSRVLFSFLPFLLATPLPLLFSAPFRPFLLLGKCSVL